MRKVIVVVIVLVVLVPIAFVLLRSATPVIDLRSSVTSLGQATPVTVHIRDAHGVRRLVALVEQNGTQYQVFDTTQPSNLTDTTTSFTAGLKTTPQLQEGKAKLILEATSNDLLRKTARLERDVTVVTHPQRER